MDWERSKIIEKMQLKVGQLSTLLHKDKSFINRLKSPIIEYSYLMCAMNQSGFLLNKDLIKRYSKFWALGTLRPSEEFKTKYFDILFKTNKTREFDILKVMHELKPYARNSFIFSHTTKLFHSVQSTLPIIDSKIMYFFQFPTVSYSNKKIDRGILYSEMYSIFIEAYGGFEHDCDLVDLIIEVESELPSFRELTFSKKLDCLITDALYLNA